MVEEESGRHEALRLTKATLYSFGLVMLVFFGLLDIFSPTPALQSFHGYYELGIGALIGLSLYLEIITRKNSVAVRH